MAIDIFEVIVKVRKDEMPAALATIVSTQGSTPGKVSQKMVILGDGRIFGTVGGGCVEADVIRAALDVIDTGRIRRQAFTLAGEDAEKTGLVCGGRIEIMIEPLNDHRAYILGCGHVGQKIAILAANAGFRTTVIDDRPDYAHVDRFPGVDEVVVCPFDELHQRIRIGVNAYIIVVTRGHSFDYTGMKWAISTSARFVGVIGSRSKRTQFFRDLAAEGVPPSTLERIQIPVGIPIGAETPEEIAISVVGELIRKRRNFTTSTPGTESNE